MKTERLTILVSSNEKKAIAAQAKVLNITASEVVRRAVAQYRPEEDEEQRLLNALADELEASARSAQHALSAARKELEATRAYFAAKRKEPPQARIA
ncbi:MAG: hypothetical protein ACREX9_24360 [Gammaproteobacteria bacterium]